MANEPIPAWGQVLQTEVKSLQSDVVEMVRDNEKRWDKNSETHKELFARTERPSRFDSLVQSVLLSLVVGLTVYLVTH